MDRSQSEIPSGEARERPSRPGVAPVRPRLAVALVFLTLTVGVVAYRISLDSGLRRVDVVAREGSRLFAAAKREKAAGVLEAGAVAEKVAVLTGARVAFPQQGDRFAYHAVSRVRIGKTAGAAVRFASEGRPCLLLVIGQETLRGTVRDEPAFLSGSGFISGERGGDAFVFWEREGTTFLLVSDGDLTSLFDLVRRDLT